MSAITTPIFHAMMMAIGATKYDTENGCIDVWNCLTDGKPNAKYDTSNVIKTRGYDNFYVELGKYANKLADYYNNIIKLSDGKNPDDLYDGCFSIEVSQKFGEWFAQFVQEHGCAPEKSDVEVAILEIMDEYMSHPATIISINPEAFPKEDDQSNNTNL